MKTETVPVLGIDTAGARIGVSLLCPDGKIRSASRQGINHERSLFPILDALMEPFGLALADLGTVCVLTGPGRFTGIRIGLTFASVLNRLAGVEARGISTLEAVAWQTAQSEDFRRFVPAAKGVVLASIIHAFRDEYYCRLFKAAGESPVPVGTARWLSGEALKTYLYPYRERLYCAGEAEPGKGLSSVIPAGVVAGPDGKPFLRPESVIRAGLDMGRSGDLIPVYLKPARYELEQHKRKGNRKFLIPNA
ncbi:MAG: tRNA (adenosine(37)-N6)-threonylcarbamoyltransferase complex dimerization subunit type 1 TsaB [bacterium]